MRLAQLDGVRGLAILCVLVYHFMEVLPPARGGLGALKAASGFGWAGVDLFFVLSGFLITGILLDTRESPHYFRSFYVRRVLRIFPLYYLTLFALLVLAPSWGLASGWQGVVPQQAWYWLHASNWKMAIDAEWPSGGFAVFWSLAIEEQFYLVWPALVATLPSRKLNGVLGLILLGCPLLRIALVATGASNPIAIYVITGTRIDTLAMGAAIAVLVRQRTDRAFLARLGTLAIVGGAAAVAAVLVAQGGPQWDGVPNLTVGLSVIALMFGGLVLLAVALPDRHPLARAFSARWLVFLGKYSYALYVFHQITLYAVIGLALGRGQSVVRAVAEAGVSPWIPVLLGALLLTFALALLSWHVLEKRCLALRRHFAYGRRTDRDAAQHGAV